MHNKIILEYNLH